MIQAMHYIVGSSLCIRTSAGLNNSVFLEDREITRGTLCIPIMVYIAYYHDVYSYLGIYLPSHCYELFHQIMTQTPNHTVPVFHLDL